MSGNPGFGALFADLGAGELIVSPTVDDPEEIIRLADVVL